MIQRLDLDEEQLQVVVYVTRDSSLLLRPLQGAFLIPPVPPVVLIQEQNHRLWR